ncbi:MAG: hypothetical protein IJ371_05610 [Clostridia bacterium]|nr:hypothetical protein [Clostridia bacterium]
MYTLNSFWLSNLTDEAVKDYASKFFDGEYQWHVVSTNCKTGKTYLEIMCEDDAGYPESHLLDAYGFVYNQLLMDASVKAWFKIVRKCNEGKTIGGISYPEAFKITRKLRAEKTESVIDVY